MRASSWVVRPASTMKMLVGISASTTDRSTVRDPSMSMSVRTRKMVNYACEG